MTLTFIFQLHFIFNKFVCLFSLTFLATSSEHATTNPSHADAANQFIQESLKLLENSRKGDRGKMKRERKFSSFAGT